MSALIRGYSSEPWHNIAAPMPTFRTSWIKQTAATFSALGLGAYQRSAVDLAAWEEFEAGRRLVSVIHDPFETRQQRPGLSPVNSFEDYLEMSRRDYVTVIEERVAERDYGWRPAWHPRPHTKDDIKQRLRTESQARAELAAEANPIQPIVLQSVEDLMNAPAPSWWIDGILPKGTTVVVGGDGGVGKSALIVEMAARMSTGSRFVGQATERARVLYAYGEGGSGYGVRFAAVAAEHGLNSDLITLTGRGVRLTDDRSMNLVRDLVERNEIDIVVFDTLSSLSTLESENDAAEMARLINRVRDVQEAREGCTAIIVHHTTKASGTLRGSSVTRDNPDVVWMLRGDRDAFSMSSLSTHGGKMKDGPDRIIHGLSLRTVDVQMPDGSVGTSVVVEWAGPQAANSPVENRLKDVATHLTQGAEYTTSEIMAAIRQVDPAASDSTLKRTITRLVSDGHLRQVGRGKYVVSEGSSA